MAGQNQQQPVVVVVPPAPQSHNFWGALSGAGIGAAVGTTVFPVVGTVVGALGGAVAGYILRDAPLSQSSGQQPQVTVQQPPQNPL